MIDPIIDIFRTTLIIMGSVGGIIIIVILLMLVDWFFNWFQKWTSSWFSFYNLWSEDWKVYNELTFLELKVTCPSDEPKNTYIFTIFNLLFELRL